ncbi:unnamed protein product [Trifolium pratense]|uniref:Uncharacterized protein n=1 Tax=Trifolium pratense TaxID=57577 RepID=A0ACB0J8N2_TRIPR|nr:unnamed protein product [Trifolium pratense]
MTPSYSPQQLDDDEVKFSDNKKYGFDGKIMFLVLVIVFSFFMVFILMVPCLKKRRARRSHEQETDSMAELNSLPYNLRRKFSF